MLSCQRQSSAHLAGDALGLGARASLSAGGGDICLRTESTLLRCGALGVLGCAACAACVFCVHRSRVSKQQTADSKLPHSETENEHENRSWS